MILNRAPHYGEDDDFADELTAMALKDYCNIIGNYQNMRSGRGPIGGGYFASTNTVSANITAGEVVGDSPDGRKKGEPTADGISPSQGNGRKGPTAIFQSAAKLPTVEVAGGQLLNMRLNHNSLASNTAIRKLAALLCSFFDLKGWHVQFNTISTEVLKDAIAHPQKYPDLIVRVAGYSALFVTLDPALPPKGMLRDAEGYHRPHGTCDQLTEPGINKPLVRGLPRRVQTNRTLVFFVQS